MKKFNIHVRNAAAAGVLASAVAFSFSLEGVHAFAAGTTTDTQATTSAETAASTNTQTTNTSATTVPSSSQTTTTDTNSSSIPKTLNSPSLLPGDLFYFVKTITEEIQLALTFNDKDKALELADFAKERLAEAQSLAAQGKTDLAKQTIDEALKMQQEAEKAAGTAAQEKSTDKAQTGTTEESAMPASTAKDQATDETNDLKSQIQAQFAQNLFALQTAIEKIDNPKAKEVLSENIKKAQEHLTKVLSNLQGNLQEQNSDDNHTVSEDNENKQSDSQTDKDQNSSENHQADVEGHNEGEHSHADGKEQNSEKNKATTSRPAQPLESVSQVTSAARNHSNNSAKQQSEPNQTEQNAAKHQSSKLDDGANDNNQNLSVKNDDRESDNQHNEEKNSAVSKDGQVHNKHAGHDNNENE
jgi:hypothetical protein